MKRVMPTEKQLQDYLNHFGTVRDGNLLMPANLLTPEYAWALVQVLQHYGIDPTNMKLMSEHLSEVNEYYKWILDNKESSRPE